MHRRADAQPEASPSADPSRGRRAALEDAQKLGAEAGPVYLVLNFLAPLVRLYALGTICFGTEGYRRLLGPVAAAVLVGMTRSLLFKLSGAAAHAFTLGSCSLEDADLAQPAGSSSLFHQVRLVLSQALRASLLGASMLACRALWFDPAPCGLADPLGQQDALLAVLMASAMFGSWSFVHARSTREKLAFDAGGTHDLSAASEDELLRLMRPPLRLASISLRCAAIAIESGADVIMIFVFLPSCLEGALSPSSVRGSPVAAPLSALVPALVYGSQHLRFRGESALGSALAAGPTLALTPTPARTQASGRCARPLGWGSPSRRTGRRVGCGRRCSQPPSSRRCAISSAQASTCVGSMRSDPAWERSAINATSRSLLPHLR